MNFVRHDKQSLGELVTGDAVFIANKRYELQKVARGGMGVVLLLQRELAEGEPFSLHGARIAVKSVLPEYLDEAHLALFRRELTVWAGFRHPNVVALDELLDAGRDGWVATMMWCKGSLRERMQPGIGMAMEHSTMILSDLVKGLVYAGKDGVLHLDLKPENVLFDPDLHRILQYPKDDIRCYRFMVSDWGIASIKQRELDAIASAASLREVSLTTFNNIGTILYMAPERFITGYRSSTASDMFSLGMIYLELLTGWLPFRANVNPVDALLSGSYFVDAVELLRRANVPVMLYPVITALLSPDPKKRPSTYEELTDVLWTSYAIATETFSVTSPIRDPFDRQTSENAAQDEFARWQELPFVRKAFLTTKREYVEKQAANLRSVGRDSDAQQCIDAYIIELFAVWEEDAANPHHLRAVATAGITLGGLRSGETLLRHAISRVESESIPLDLTLAHFNLGRILHQLRRDDGEELWCYEMAVAAEAPANCRFPAGWREKTRAHLFAQNRAAVEGKKKHEQWHRRRLRELAPEVDWDNPEAVTRFLTSVSDEERQESERADSDSQPSGGSG